MRIELLDKLAKKGDIFSIKEAKEIAKIDINTLRVILSRLENKGWIERIERGKYLIIPIGFIKGSYTIHEFEIGTSLVKPSCISYWSALHSFGLTDQIPKTVFIQTTSRKKKQNMNIFGIDYKIIRIKETKYFGVISKWFNSNQIKITGEEKTIIDCLDKPQYCGGIIEVVNAISNNGLDIDKLAEYAIKLGNSGVIRRLGYICDLYSINISLPDIKTRNYLKLDPTMSFREKKNSKWKLSVNVDIDK